MVDKLAVTENQFIAIANAAAVLFPADRDRFVTQVAQELAGQTLGDGSLHRAIAKAQRELRQPPPEVGRGNHVSRWAR